MFELKDGFKVRRTLSGMELVGLESDRLDACLRFAKKISADGVVVSRHHGFKEKDLECLLDWPGMKSLYVVDAWPNLSAIEKLTELEWMQVGGTLSEGVLRLSSFPKLKLLRATWWPQLDFEDASTSLIDAYISDYRPSARDCNSLRPLRSLRKLEICGSNIRSLDGLDAMSGLEELYILEGRSLEDIGALRSCRKTLRHLTLGHCRKIDPITDVRVLTSLVSLNFYASADIPSFRFIDDLKTLTHLGFLKTKVLDGDLQPLLRLVDVSFDSARGLSHTQDEVRRIISARRA